MSDEVVYFGFVVEGQGEVQALPNLTRRICNQLFNKFSVRMTQPVRVTKSQLIRHGELERAIRLALINNQSRGPVLVMLDADDDCPAVLGPKLKSRALAVIQSQNFSISIPKCEFEAWFLAAAASLSGTRGLRNGLTPPSDPEAIRGAKQWLSRNMAAGHKYSPSVDQAAMVSRMDLAAAMTCRSFERLCREIKRLVTAP
jgi:Domain of unknown function (DUF4276)